MSFDHAFHVDISLTACHFTIHAILRIIQKKTQHSCWLSCVRDLVTSYGLEARWSSCSISHLRTNWRKLIITLRFITLIIGFSSLFCYLTCVRPRNEQHKHVPQLQNEYFFRFFLKQWYLNNFCDYKVGLADFENEWCQGTSDSANKYKLESKLIGKTRNGIFLLQKKKEIYIYIQKKCYYVKICLITNRRRL